MEDNHDARGSGIERRRRSPRAAICVWRTGALVRFGPVIGLAFFRLVVLVAFLTGLFPLLADGAKTGSGELTTVQRGISLSVFTYRSEGCVPRGVLLVFHGINRNADDYRDHARRFARRTCLSVYAPRFDRERFKGWQYQRGGIVRRQIPESPDDWTVSLVQGLVNWALEREGGAGKPVYLFGHSAGAQFLSRVAAYAPPPGVRRFVVANPSSHVWPSLEEPIPYGFGEFPSWFPKPVLSLKRYLSLPVTIYLGSEDTGSRRLSRKAAAVRQGVNRFDRGENAFQAAQALAREKGWAFNWKLVIAIGVGHSARRMLRAFEAEDAFGMNRQ